MTPAFRRFLGACAIALFAAAPPAASAAELVYRPVNPSFGGDPINGNWLLSQASAQAPGASGGGTGGFTIDFPDFGSIPQTPTTDPTTLPNVPVQTPTTPATGN